MGARQGSWFIAAALASLGAAEARGATLMVTTNIVTDSPDGACDLVEATAAVMTQQPIHGDCAAGDGADEIVLAADGTYVLDRTLRIVSSLQIRAAPSIHPVIAGGENWQDDLSDPWSNCVLYVSGQSASLSLTDVTVSQGASVRPLTGVCVTAGSFQIRHGRITRFGRGGIVSLCEPASGCDHDGLAQFSAVAVLSSLIDLNASPSDGAGISARGLGASLIVEHSSIVNNSSEGNGGGIALGAGWNNQRVASSTVSGNSALNGGGIFVHFAPGTNTYLYLLNSTVANNRATYSGGGVAFTGDGFTQDLNVYATILADNEAGTDETNVNGDWGSSRMSCTSSSLIYVTPGRPVPNALPGAPCRYDVPDARLGPLMSMGGAGDLPVHPLLPGSPAIDAAGDDQALDEQRDDWIASIDAPAPDDWTLFERVVDGDGDGVAARDLGAYEVNLRWQMELLAVEATGPGAHTVVTAPIGFDRGAGTRYAATSATGEHVTYALPVAQPGRYAVAVGALRGPDSGVFQLAVSDQPDGPWRTVGPLQDTYAATPAFAELGPLAVAAFSTEGQKYLRFEVAGRNEQSSGYELVLDYVALSAATDTGGSGGGGCGCEVGFAQQGSWPGLLTLTALATIRRERRRTRVS